MSGFKEKAETRNGGREVWRCFNKRFHVEKHSLSPIPPHYPSTGPRDGWQKRARKEMTFSFVLLRTPYYHLSEETSSSSIRLFCSFFFFLALNHNGLAHKFFSFRVCRTSLPRRFFLFSLSPTLPALQDNYTAD